MKYLLETVIDIPLPLETVFEFFASAHNLEKITPPEMAFHLVNPDPIEMREGQEIDYRLKMMGLPMKWRSRITEWKPPYLFTDVQIRGPYASWVHRHFFEKIEKGTRVRDRVEYESPFAPLGDLAHLFVRRQLNHIFAFRQKAIRDELLPDYQLRDLVPK